MVLEVSDQSARIGLQPGRDPGGFVSKERAIGILPLEGVKWAKVHGKVPAKVGQVSSPGDVVYVAPCQERTASTACSRCRKSPAPWWWRTRSTGRVLAMVGGFSYDQSQFNRATQALRQPGSSFKPIVYAAALDNGYTPSSLVLDAPIEIDQGPGLGVWKPENYEGDFYGPSTLRFGIEHSRNVMTVRLAQDIGMPLIAEYAKRFGVYDNLPPYLSFALGAGETTLLRMVTAYGMIDNGGRKIKPTLIDRIQDRYGHTVYKHDERECIGCDAKKWQDQPEPSLIDRREQVLDPMTAYQITSIMEGVVQRGTAGGVGFQREVGKPVAGKTGTTNDYKDAWFIGFTPDIVVGVYIGYDKPKSLGRGETGGQLAAPIVKDFMKVALADKPAVPFRVPPGIKLIRVDLKTGMRAGPDDAEGDPGSLQARHRAARQLFGGRHHGRHERPRWSRRSVRPRPPLGRGRLARRRPRRALGDGRAVLRISARSGTGCRSANIEKAPADEPGLSSLTVVEYRAHAALSVDTGLSERGELGVGRLLLLEVLRSNVAQSLRPSCLAQATSVP